VGIGLVAHNGPRWSCPGRTTAIPKLNFSAASDLFLKNRKRIAYPVKRSSLSWPRLGSGRHRTFGLSQRRSWLDGCRCSKYGPRLFTAPEAKSAAAIVSRIFALPLNNI